MDTENRARGSILNPCVDPISSGGVRIRDGESMRGGSLTTLEPEAIECVNMLALRPDIRLEMRFEPGDPQLLNNHCILHARGAYEDEPAD